MVHLNILIALTKSANYFNLYLMHSVNKKLQPLYYAITLLIKSNCFKILTVSV